MPWHISRVLMTLYGKMAQEWNNKILLSHACLLSNLSAKKKCIAQQSIGF